MVCMYVCTYYVLYFFNFPHCVFFVWFLVFKWHKFNFIMVNKSTSLSLLKLPDSGCRTALTTSWWFLKLFTSPRQLSNCHACRLSLLTVNYGLSFILTLFFVLFFFRLFLHVFARFKHTLPDNPHLWSMCIAPSWLHYRTPALSCT